MKTLHLKMEIYSYEAIRAATQDYSGLCSIKVTKADDEWLVSLSDCKYDEDRTALEFENYLIGLENT